MDRGALYAACSARREGRSASTQKTNQKNDASQVCIVALNQDSRFERTIRTLPSRGSSTVSATRLRIYCRGRRRGETGVRFTVSRRRGAEVRRGGSFNLGVVPCPVTPAFQQACRGSRLIHTPSRS
jgi:hypothetical protein